MSFVACLHFDFAARRTRHENKRGEVLDKCEKKA